MCSRAFRIFRHPSTALSKSLICGEMSTAVHAKSAARRRRLIAVTRKWKPPRHGEFGINLAEPVFGEHVRLRYKRKFQPPPRHVCLYPNKRHSGQGWECLKLAQLGHWARLDGNGRNRPRTAVHWSHSQWPLTDQKAVVRTTLCKRPVLNIPLEFGRGNLKKVSGSLVRDRSCKGVLG